MKSSNVFAHETLLHSFLFGIVGVMKLYTALILGLIISFTCLQLQIMVSDYSLAHKDHRNVLHEMLRKNINLDTTADVTLVSADNTKHFAHRYILGTQSPVMADLFDLTDLYIQSGIVQETETLPASHVIPTMSLDASNHP